MVETKRINRYKVAKTKAYIILVMLVLIGIVIGFFIGRVTSPEKINTVVKTIEVPVYNSSTLPKTSELSYYNVPLSHSLQNYIYEICADENVPIELVFAMIEQESQFNPEAVSGTDDYGLMQINKINHDHLAEDYQCADMLNPYQNVFCGVKIISTYIEKYEDYGKALMAYNMGDYGANKAWKNGINSTNYSSKILGLMEKYKELSND